MFGQGQIPCCLQVLGCLLIAGGVLSVLGSMRKNTNMLTGALAAALIGMLLAFSFVAQVRQSCIQPEAEYTTSCLEMACFLNACALGLASRGCGGLHAALRPSWFLQTSRELQVDCALAELYTKQIATQQLTEHHQQAEIFHSIHNRMNEVSALVCSQPAGSDGCLDWCETAGRRWESVS